MSISLSSLAGRFKNNALALVNAVLSFANSVLYIRAFGVSATSDALYYAAAVIAAFSLLPNFLTEQFLQYYNDYKHEDPDRAATFLAFNLALGLGFGALLTAAFGLGSGPLLRLLYPGLGPEPMGKLAAFLGVMKYQLFFVGSSGVLQSLTVSYGRVRTVYLARIINSSMVFLGQLAIILSLLEAGAYPFLLVAADAAFALFLCGANLPLLAGAARNLKKADRAFAARQGRYFLDSFVMRLGHNLQGFFLPLITSSFWSGFSGNMATCYGYASKFYGAIQSVVVGPSQMETQYLVSNAVSRGEYGGIGRTIRDYLKLYVPLTLAASAAAALLIPPVIRVINGAIGPESVRLIILCFVFLSGWLAIQCAEGPFVLTIVARNKGLVFVVANAVNIAVIAAIIFAFPRFFYSILIANILAQAASMSIYVGQARAILRDGIASGAKGMA